MGPVVIGLCQTTVDHADPIKCYLLPGVNQIHALNDNRVYRPKIWAKSV